MRTRLNSTAKKAQPANPAVACASFDARLTAPILSAGSYRIFVERSDLVFIQIEGGKNQIIAAAAPLLGPIGSLIPLALWLFNKRTTREKRERLETRDPEELLRESAVNFKLHAAEIRDVSIEPPKLFMESGKAGRLNFSVRYDEHIRCEFENAAEMTKAIQMLTRLFHSTLRVNVEWNEKAGKFQKKKW